MCQLDENWLSLDAFSSRVSFGGPWYSESTRFGEHNSDNKLHGKGIDIDAVIDANGDIYIGYYNNGFVAPGKYIFIYGGGEFSVGEIYMKDGK